MSALIDGPEARLRAILRDLGRVVIAFSGGVDSAVLLAIAREELGDDVLAVTGNSASVAHGELEAAVALAKRLAARHEVIATHEFDNPDYLANPVARCYYCKDELFSLLREIADERGYAYVVDGSNADDGKAPLDRRPGTNAARRLGVRSPLAEAGLTKDAIRAIAKRQGLPVHDKPATPCLSSRVPHGTRIEVDDLRRIDLAERYLRALGYPIVRVRHFGRSARIEVPLDRVEPLRASQTRIGNALQSIGYERIEIDPRGYRTGSLNESGATQGI